MRSTDSAAISRVPPSARDGAAQGLRLLLSFCYFFSLLAAYYVLRPVREEMGVQFGPHRMQWLFTGTFVTMLLLVPVYGAVVSKFRRRVFVPAVYLLFVLCLIGFHSQFNQARISTWLVPTFFIWVSVFNLFAVSVFWSFMADVWDPGDAKRWFGVIAAGGTAGGLTGPLLTGLLVSRVGIAGLMLIAAGLLLVALMACLGLSSSARQREQGTLIDDAPPIGGTVLAGIRLLIQRPELRPLALMMFFGVLMGSVIYFQQAKAVEAAIADSTARTTFFASIDGAVNGLTLLAQLGLTRLLFTRFGMGRVLMIPPLLAALCLGGLALMPSVLVLSVVQVITRAGRFAITEPAFASLYTSLDREVRYKTKGFIDTAVYRFGDLSSAWLVPLLTSFGVALSGFALLGSLVSVLLTRLGFVAGSAHEQRLLAQTETSKPDLPVSR